MSSYGEKYMTVFDELVGLGGRHRLEHSGFAAAVSFAEEIAARIGDLGIQAEFCASSAQYLITLEDDCFSGIAEWLRDLDIPDRVTPQGPREIWGTVVSFFEDQDLHWIAP